MKTKKLDVFKYITFGTLIVSIINCLISVSNLANAEMDNGVYSVLFIIFRIFFQFIINFLF